MSEKFPNTPAGLAELDPVRAALREHIFTHSLKTGDFTLKSGRKSSWFLDTKQTACRADGIVLVAEAALTSIPESADAIGGLTMGADPVAFGVAAGMTPMKKHTHIALSAIAALSFTSCGGSSGSSDTTAAPDTTVAPVDTAATKLAAVTISVTVGKDNSPDRVEKVALGSEVTLTLTNPDADDE
ncbi:MAG: hypothetical protein EBS32_05255, partial [Actinobacteria bacterium]|nr:hypothetical protein [Actinomycetota bacterium]